MATKANYIHMPDCDSLYRCYVVALQSSLSLHLDIHWPENVSKRYISAINYSYSYIAEEFPGQVLQGRVYSCHLKNVEIAKDPAAARECNIFVSKEIYKWGGWFLVSVGDIDIYRRILVTLLPIASDTPTGSQVSINDKLLDYISPRTGNPIAIEYVRPRRNINNRYYDDTTTTTTTTQHVNPIQSVNFNTIANTTTTTSSMHNANLAYASTNAVNDHDEEQSSDEDENNDDDTVTDNGSYYIYVYPDDKMKSYLTSLLTRG